MISVNSVANAPNWDRRISHRGHRAHREESVWALPSVLSVNSVANAPNWDRRISHRAHRAHRAHREKSVRALPSVLSVNSVANVPMPRGLIYVRSKYTALHRGKLLVRAEGPTVICCLYDGRCISSDSDSATDDAPV